MKKTVILFLITLFILGGCSGRKDLISISGSSTVYPITLEAQEKYIEEKDNNLHMSVESNGTGGGFELFCEGKTQVNDASRAINEDEKALAAENNIDYSEYKIGVDGITVIINNDNEWAKDMTAEELKQAFELGSDVAYWSDINPSYPEEEINFYGPTSASGTYDFFVETIIGNDNGAIRDDMNATENDNEVVTNIEKDKYGIGFLGYSYYSSNKDKVQEVAVDGIAPDEKSIKSGDYILSRPLYIYVNNADMEKNSKLKNFITYYIENSQYLVNLAGYIPLNDEEEKLLVASLEA